jgi:hypothetical protein
MRLGVVALALFTVLTAGAPSADGADGVAPAPVIISLSARGPVRVQVAEGVTTPCDSSNNRMLFDGAMAPGQNAWSTQIAGECVCVRWTSDAFPRSDWSTPGLACRPRVCRGRICRPAPDPAIRLHLDATSR